MKLLNFSHPLTPKQLQTLREEYNLEFDDVLAHPAQFDVEQPFGAQATELVAGVPLTAEEWQTEPLLVNLPSLSIIASLVLAELNGRCGHFPAVLRLRPVANAVVPQYEVAEVLNLEGIRLAARERRE